MRSLAFFDTSRPFDTDLDPDGVTEASVLPAVFLICKCHPKLLHRMEANSENEQLVDLVPQMQCTLTIIIKAGSPNAGVVMCGTKETRSELDGWFFD